MSQKVQLITTATQQTSYVRLRNTRTKMYAGCVACCPLVNHVECAPRALLRLEKKMAQKDGRRDGRQTVRIRSPLDAASAIAEESYTWAISFCFLLFILSPAFFHFHCCISSVLPSKNISKYYWSSRGFSATSELLVPFSEWSVVFLAHKKWGGAFWGQHKCGGDSRCL